MREFRERGFLPAALLNHLFRLGHTADVDGWLPPARACPRTSGPEHLGRAPARFEESQLLHWQKETLQHMSAAEIAAWLGLPDSAAFVELVRHNVVLPAGCGALGGRGARGVAAARRRGAARRRRRRARVLRGRGGGAGSSRAPDLHALAALLKRAHRAQGRRELFMPLRVALTGQTHGPELAPLLKLMPPETARAPARIPCSRSITRSPARRPSSSRCARNEVRMYVCGITVYDYIHIGHARMLTVFDLVQRYLRSRGYAVTYVRNITDIDDKIIQRAAENGEDWSALARRFIAAMHEDCALLGLQAARLRAARHRVHRRRSSR